jgi:hypothetical protein
MKDVLKSSTFWFGFIWCAIFLPIAFLLPRQALYELLNAIVFSCGSGIVWAYRKQIITILKCPLRDLSGGQLLQLGIFGGWGATASIFFVLWYWRLHDKNIDVVDSLGNAASRWLLILAAMSHLSASGAIRDNDNDQSRIPPNSYLRTGTYVALGILLGALTIGFFDISK